MILKPLVLDYVGKLLLDKELWSRAKSLVFTASSTDLTGEQKRQKVRQDLLFFSSTLASSLLNFVIELAVQYVKSQQK